MIDLCIIFTISSFFKLLIALDNSSFKKEDKPSTNFEFSNVFFNMSLSFSSKSSIFFAVVIVNFWYNDLS